MHFYDSTQPTKISLLLIKFLSLQLNMTNSTATQVNSFWLISNTNRSKLRCSLVKRFWPCVSGFVAFRSVSVINDFTRRLFLSSGELIICLTLWSMWTNKAGFGKWLNTSGKADVWMFSVGVWRGHYSDYSCWHSHVCNTRNIIPTEISRVKKPLGLKPEQTTLNSFFCIYQD